MSLKVKYSALQKAGQQGIFFFSHAAKMSHFILCGIEKSGTPMQCPSTTCRSFEQITPQNASLCPTPLILKFEVLISSKFKIFFSFLKKKKSWSWHLQKIRLSEQLTYNLVFNFIFLNLFSYLKGKWVIKMKAP